MATRCKVLRSAKGCLMIHAQIQRHRRSLKSATFGEILGDERVPTAILAAELRLIVHWGHPYDLALRLM